MTKRNLLTKRNQKLIIGLVVALLSVIFSRSGLMSTGQVAKVAQQNQPGLYRVTKFIDGDTIEVNMSGVAEKVRFIGVDTPETHDPRKAVQCFGQAAANHTKQLIGNQPVRLQADTLNTNRDRYNRLLRYVYLPDGTLVNAKIIEDGYGFAYTSFPFSKLEQFRSLQEQARTQNRGLWGHCQPVKNNYGGYTSNNAQT